MTLKDQRQGTVFELLKNGMGIEHTDPPRCRPHHGTEVLHDGCPERDMRAKNDRLINWNGRQLPVEPEQLGGIDPSPVRACSPDNLDGI